MWEAETYYHINTWFPFVMNNFFSVPFSGACFILRHNWGKPYNTSDAAYPYIYFWNGTCLKYDLWKCSYKQPTVITQPDKQRFMFYYQPNTNNDSGPNCLLTVIFVDFPAICAATALRCDSHQSCYSQGIMIFDHRIQEINSWKTGYGWVMIAPFYWQSFRTDQN